MTQSLNRTLARKAGVALLGAAALVLAAGAPALAATGANAGSGASLTVDPVAGVVADGSTGAFLDGLAAGTVSVDGSGFVATPATTLTPSGVGVYLVYGPKRAATYNTDSSVYNDAVWLNEDGLFGSPVFVGGGFDDVDIDVAASYTTPVTPRGGGVSVDCTYDATLSAAQNAALGKERCYIQTFTANGLWASSPNAATANEVAIEVVW